eukprot:TRINITY_DN4821_c0_g2_i1.p1 TRINITY_DN4821_c0_g2~~TRINITY_DN4821_c0_g2_i1.p1  ORF type:complete len:384 (+),score=23.72 TRINITY_DN4821_c0_g2_i1:147-1154(+)
MATRDVAEDNTENKSLLALLCCCFARRSRVCEQAFEGDETMKGNDNIQTGSSQCHFRELPKSHWEELTSKFAQAPREDVSGSEQNSDARNGVDEGHARLTPAGKEAMSSSSTAPFRREAEKWDDVEDGLLVPSPWHVATASRVDSEASSCGNPPGVEDTADSSAALLASPPCRSTRACQRCGSHEHNSADCNLGFFKHENACKFITGPNGCKFGSRCRFSHAQRTDEKTEVFITQMPCCATGSDIVSFLDEKGARPQYLRIPTPTTTPTIFLGHRSGRFANRGFAFLGYESKQAALDAIRRIDAAEFVHRSIVKKVAARLSKTTWSGEGPVFRPG